MLAQTCKIQHKPSTIHLWIGQRPRKTSLHPVLTSARITLSFRREWSLSDSSRTCSAKTSSSHRSWGWFIVMCQLDWGAQIFHQRLFCIFLYECFGLRLTFEFPGEHGGLQSMGLQRVSRDWAHLHITFELVMWNQIKQISLPNVGGPHPIRWRPSRKKKKAEFAPNKREFFLSPGLWSRTLDFSCLLILN